MAQESKGKYLRLSKKVDEDKDYVTYLSLSHVVMYVTAFYKVQFFVDLANALYQSFIENDVEEDAFMFNLSDETRILN